MKSFANCWVFILFLVMQAHAGIDGTKVANSVMLNSSSSFVKKADSTQAVIQCEGSDPISATSGKILSLAQRMQKINSLMPQESNSYICHLANSTIGRFSTESCNKAINCRKSFSELSGSRAQKIIDETIAKDYAANMLKYKTEKMDEFELLKRFADKKYNIKSPACHSRYELPQKGSTCNLNLLEEAFLSNQESCQSGDSCFNKKNNEYLTFKDYKEKNKMPDSAFVVDYNDYRINQEIAKLEKDDNELLDTLANLVMSASFSKLSGDKKADLFLKELESSDGVKYKDPFFASYFGKISNKNDFKKESPYKAMVEILEKPFSSAESFKSTYEEMRKITARIALENTGTCSNKVDLKNICEEMTKVSKGEKIFKDSFEADLLSTKGLSNEKEYDKVKSLIGENLTRDKYEVLLNANRCLAFQLGSEEKARSIADTSKVWFEYQNGSTPAVAVKEKSPVIDVSPKDQFGISQNKNSPSSDQASLKDLDPEVSDNVKKFSTAISDTQSATNNFSNQFNQSYTPSNYGLDDSENNEDDGDDEDNRSSSNGKKDNSTKSLIPAGTSPLDPTISDLMKRLEIAEENVDKMKADQETAENDRVKQKKIDEENALITELRNQITDLKSSKEKSASEKASVVTSPSNDQQNGFSSGLGSSSSNSLAIAPTRQDAGPKVADNYDSTRSSDPAASANAASARSPNAPMLTSSSNNDGNKVLQTGALLTTVDGMTSEKALQTITKRIIELNGTPFYIEEGGMVKEIIAIIKDGKVQLDENGNPLYEKIVKGKVGDKKFAIASDKKRAPAAITDVADLRRDQEEKLKRDSERAEYLKLMNLTNGVLNNK